MFLFTCASHITILLIYVDDIVITGDDALVISLLQKYLCSRFNIKDLGSLKYFLGIKVARSKAGIFLNERKYAL